MLSKLCEHNMRTRCALLFTLESAKKLLILVNLIDELARAFDRLWKERDHRDIRGC
jgi:hypothetical protein